MNFDEQIKNRRAIEALRSGVPNRDAVLALGCTQPDIENRFRQQLQKTKQSGIDGSKATGMLVGGDFGAGKSHLLEYLMHVALEENFVCSKVVISKETPLYDPVKLYRAAIESAIVPRKRGFALTEIATSLNIHSNAYARFYEWLNQPESELNPRFAATVFLFERMSNDPELSDRIIRFWAGDKIGVSEIKKYLKACRETVTYKVENIPVKQLALQRFKFASRLMVAAGYAGWILLIDEVELIGRYTLTQRARSYAGLARWMGKLRDTNCPGLSAVFSITDDFERMVLLDKGDIEKVPAKLRATIISESDRFLADQAEAGMSTIQKERISLKSPNFDLLSAIYNKSLRIHGDAYGWEPPSIPLVKKETSTRMRTYVKGWITEWDLKRLYPSYQPEIQVKEVISDYEEDANLQIASEEESNDQTE